MNDEMPMQASGSVDRGAMAQSGCMPDPPVKPAGLPENASYKVIVVMPAYNAEFTLEKTLRSIPAHSVAEVILTDDCSSDRTVEVARRLGITTIRHERNRGYGGNLKTCFAAALERKPDAVVVLHPDDQYDGRLVPYLAGFLEAGACDVVIGSRIRSRRETLRGGMPVYKYLFNRVLTIMMNVVLGQHCSDLHSGYRAYTREVLEAAPFAENSDGFVFDVELLVQAVLCGARVGEVPVPTRYHAEASSINLVRSLGYGLRTVWTLLKYRVRRIHTSTQKRRRPFCRREQK